ncbi:MAG: response regulator transcription factor [Acidobacteria bacterium]|jgi:two-component system LytT family response regulator|nr:response regulator transcription factor [Acidobacteriota bacterium]
MKKIWKALIIDDERLARAKLRSLLAEHSNIEIAGEADSVIEAVKLIENTKLDVLFLDIQMPHASGFDLLEQVETNVKIIFVTAFDEYAIRAFEVNALDYLLKPVNPERLKQAIERLSSTNDTPEKTLEYDDFLFINTVRQSKFIKINRIKFISAADVYSEVFTDDGAKFLLLKPLVEWEQTLPQKNFMRIHRSTIVNLEYVEKVEKWFNYSYQIHMRGVSEPFVISRRYASKLKDRF